MRLLPQLDFKLLTANPKILIGYSDITGLLLSPFTRQRDWSLSTGLRLVPF